MATDPPSADDAQGHRRIAELEQQVARLEQDNANLRAVVNTADVALFVHTLDETGTIEYVNQPMLDMYGLDYETALNLKVAALSSPVNDLAQIGVMLRRANAGETPTFPWKALRPGDTSEFDVEVTLQQISWNGTPHILAAVRQTTEQREMEAQLTRTRRLMQGFLDHLTAAMFVRDRDGRFLLINQYYARMLNRAVADILGKTLYDLIDSASAELFYHNDQQVISSGEVLETEERSSLGTHIAIKFPIRDEHGTITAVGGISTDISERKQLEEELQLFKVLVDRALDGVLITMYDADDTPYLAYTNQAFRTMVGYDDEFHEGYLDHINAPDMEQYDQAPRIARQTGAWQGIHTFQRRDNTTFPASVMVRYFYLDQDEQQPVMVMIARDISDIRQSEAERERLQQQVIDAQRAAIRELSTPLIPIAENALVMPLIGALDTQRALQVLETLVEGVVAHQAEIAILDITGIETVDTQVVDVLVKAARAVNLLGARVMLTGMQPRIAQTMVEGGVELHAIQVRSSLRAGIIEVLLTGAAPQTSARPPSAG